jgi:hypothetical protein
VTGSVTRQRENTVARQRMAAQANDASDNDAAEGVPTTIELPSP